MRQSIRRHIFKLLIGCSLVIWKKKMWVILLFSGPLCPGTPGRMLELWVTAVMAPQTYLLSDLNLFLTNHCQKYHMQLSILACGWFQVRLYILVSEWKEWTTEMWVSLWKRMWSVMYRCRCLRGVRSAAMCSSGFTPTSWCLQNGEALVNFSAESWWRK